MSEICNTVIYHTMSLAVLYARYMYAINKTSYISEREGFV